MTAANSPLSFRHGEWHIANCSLNKIAAEFKTPLFVYDQRFLENQFRSLREALPDIVDLYYSIKANPNPAIVSRFAACAAGLEIASAAEYEIARKAGAPVERILFAGPGKTLEELEYVLQRGIGELHIESSEELDAIKALDVPVNVSIRFNPAAEASGGAMRMGGKPSQFGFDEEQLPQIVDQVLGAPGLIFRGLHMFAGTQLLDAEVLLSQWSHTVTVARRIAAHVGEPLKTVDLGGGLGIPYFSSETALDLTEVRKGAAVLFGSLEDDPLFSGTRFIVEPGRFLAGPAGVYIARVVSVKHSRGTRFIVLDGGMNHHLAASGNLGQVIKKDYPILNVSRSEDAPREPAVVVGPLCTPLDTLGRRVTLPNTEPGDLIAVMQSGAYGLSASPVGFLSHRLPAEVLIDGSIANLVGERGSFANPLRKFD
ncbi:MAG: type III PLP-dependent enzyme [Gammaproteobacteria bacterium]|nr:type III PLP-dependent enzyme [Gammaproteobacteria bacterium]